MNRNYNVSPGRYTIILIGFLVGTGFYIADIIIDVFVFHSGTLAEEILNPTYHEMWMRMAVFLIAVTSAIYVQLLLRREHEISERAMLAEKFLGSVFDNIPNMVFIKDAKELRFIRINRAGEKLLGLTNHEIVGKKDSHFFPGPQAEYFIKKDHEVLESGAELDIPEEQIDTVNQGKRWLHTRKVPIFDEEGQPIYLLGISDDITKAKQSAADLRETEVRFQTLFNSAADYIFVVDPHGIVLHTNRYACENSGYERQEIVGSNIKKFFTQSTLDTYDSNFADLGEQGYHRAGIEFVCKDGQIRQMEYMASGIPDENGCFTSFLVIQRDMTDKILAEEEIRHQQRTLTHFMRLSTMGELVTGIAHELNQPLTALTSYCGTAANLAKSQSPPSSQLRDILTRAEKQAYRASHIVSQLRDFLRKEDGHRENVDIEQVIREVIEFIKPELNSGQVTAEYHSDTRGRSIMASKVQIEQVLVNLVMNSLEAIKDSGMTTGKIIIQACLLPDDSIETTVADNGPGIDADMAGTIFNPFQTSKSSGMGLGLSISRSIIEAHNGKLWVDEQYRDGALFGFNLPCAMSE